MVEEVFEDLEDDTGLLNFTGWRCLTCGEILDPTIAQHRIGHMPPMPQRARMRDFARVS
jgi:hypothetical protein